MIPRPFAALVCVSLAASAADAAPPGGAPRPLIVPAPDALLPAGMRVSVRFNPPLGRPLRFLWEESAGGRLIRQEILVRFEKIDGGYRMEASAPRPSAGLPPRLLLAFQPIVLRLDADGIFTAIEDPAGYWRATDALLARFRADPRLGGEAAELAAAGAAARSMPAGMDAYWAARTYAPVTLMSRLEVGVGEKMEIPPHAGHNTAVPEEMLTRSLVFTAASATPARLRMEVKADYDEAGSKRIVERLGGPSGPAAVKAGAGRVVETTLHEVESATGLAVFHEDRFSLVANGRGEPLRTVRLTRLDSKR
jgi:hypothetical protein